MHLLYLDDSGSPSDPDTPYFVLAGVSVFERKTHWIEKRLNEIVERFAPSDPYSLELHGSPMRTGKGGWRQYPYQDRHAAMVEALQQGVVMNARGVTLFGVAVRHGSLGRGESPVEYAFEQLSSRFDQYLMRLHHKGDSQRGIMIMDKSSTERKIQSLAREFKHSGHTWGRTKNYAEVPLFLNSQSSRLIQLADLVAYAIYRHLAHSDDSLYQVIANSFDQESGDVHGFHVRG